MAPNIEQDGFSILLECYNCLTKNSH